MNNLAYMQENETYASSNIISFELLRSRKEIVEVDEYVESNRAGKSSEVYAFRTKEEIKAMIDVFDKHIKEAENNDQRRIARRNKMLFVIGINVGIRGSDLHMLTWDFFYEKQIDGSLKFRDCYTLQPKKTRKNKKFVKLYFNDAVKKIINDYVNDYPFDDIKEYLFVSRKGDKPISVGSLWRIIKNTAKEAGINQNIGSHSLRKTFGRMIIENAKDKTQALILLQHIFNHDSSATTLRYIGLVDDDMEEAFNSINLGIEFI